MRTISIVEEKFRSKIKEAKFLYLQHLKSFPLRTKEYYLHQCNIELAKVSSLAWVLNPQYQEVYIDDEDFISYCEGKHNRIGIKLFLDEEKSYKIYFILED